MSVKRNLMPVLLVLGGWVSAGQAQDAPKVQWQDVRALGVEGQGWAEDQLKAPFDRLPARAEGKVPDSVWGLSHQSAGLCVRFVTDAPSIQARWTLTSKNLALPHMPATGVSGLDLYARVEGGWRWLGAGRPSSTPPSTETLASGLPPGPREYLLYFPLYNGVTSVELGVPEGHAVSKAPERPESHRKPIVVYGTSITQGGCASRPGMVHTSILGRRLDRPVINLGFSGSGRMEPALAELLAELDPAVYVLDCLPNMTADLVAERVAPFVRTLRKARPETPIVLAEDRNYTHGVIVTSARNHNEANHAALKKVYEELIAEGVQGLTYLPGAQQIGDDGEGTVDGSHPTDLGFYRMADVFEAAIRPLLPQD
jgi:lysophospholipase L1-like esterase